MLKGTLDEFALPDVFRLLSQSKKTGCLDVVRSAGQGRVYFRDGDVYFAESTVSRELLGQKLVNAGALSQSQLMRALDEQAESGGRIGDILRGSDSVTQEQIEGALKEQIEDAAFDLLRWELGEFDWLADETVEPEVSLSVTVENLVMEASRRLDEYDIIRRRIPSEEAVVAMAPAPPEGAAQINITPDEWRVLVMVNGNRTVLEIAEGVNGDIFETMRTLYGLLSAGLIEVPGVSVPEDEEWIELPSQRVHSAVPFEPATVPETAVEVGTFEDDTFQDGAVTAEPEPEADAEAESTFEPEAASEAEAASEPEPTTEPEAGFEPETPEAEAFQPETFQPETPEAEVEAVASNEDTDEEFSALTDTEGDEAVAVEASGEADPFADELFTAESAVPPAPDSADDAQVAGALDDAAADYLGTGPAFDSESEIPVAANDRDPIVDKTAAVRELSNLFKQSEVDTNPSFIVPPIENKTPEASDDEAESEGEVDDNVPLDPRRVEDDEEITRGLISRLIDGVKGL